jgi:hypothetical protein
MMKTIFPEDIPEEMEELCQVADNIDDSLKPIQEADEKPRRITEGTTLAIESITERSSALNALQGFRMNSFFHGVGELALSSVIPDYSFTNPVLKQLKENVLPTLSGIYTATSAVVQLTMNQRMLRCYAIYIETDTESAEYRLKVIGTISEK